MMVTQDQGLTKYLDNVLRQLSQWLQDGKLQKLVLVISSLATRQTLERWTFNVETDKAVVEGGYVRCSILLVHYVPPTLVATLHTKPL